MSGIGKKIKNLRKKERLTQDAFADKVGVSRQIISKWESGRIVPSTKNLVTICESCKTSLSYFLDDEGTIEYEDKNNEKRFYIISNIIISLVLTILFSMLITIVFFVICYILPSEKDMVVAVQYIYGDELILIILLFNILL